jgi:acetyl esterase/lipase
MQYKTKQILLDENRPEVWLTRLEFSVAGQDGKPRPPVIICPGGGYHVIGTSEGIPAAEKFADAGYAPFVLNYSIQEDARFDADSHPPNKAVSDLANSVTLLHENADEWGLDVDRLIIAGFSAGGHVVGTYVGESVTAMKGILQVPKIVLLVYPLVALELPLETDEGSLMMLNAIFGENTLSQETLEIFDTKSRVVPGWPETFLFHCKKDHMVPFESSVELAEKFTEQNIPHLFYEAETGIHTQPFSNEEWWPVFLSWLRERIY